MPVVSLTCRPLEELLTRGAARSDHPNSVYSGSSSIALTLQPLTPPQDVPTHTAQHAQRAQQLLTCYRQRIWTETA